MNKQKMLAMSLALAFVFALAGCSKSQPTTSKVTADTEDEQSVDASYIEEEYEEIPPIEVENNTLVVAFDNNNAPYSSVNEQGELEGFDVDVAKLVCETNGWTLDAQAIDWSTKDKVLSSGEVDCVWGEVKYIDAYYTDNNQEWVSYGEIYVDVTARYEDGYRTMDDLAGKHIEVEPSALFTIEGDRATEWGKKVAENAGRVTKVKDAQTAYDDLLAGKCDGVIVSSRAESEVEIEDESVELVVLYNVDVYSDEMDEETFGTEETVCDVEHGVGFAIDHEYTAYIEQTISNMLMNGDIEQILDKWIEIDGNNGQLNTTFYLYSVNGEDTQEEEGIFEMDGDDAEYEIEVEEA